MGGVDLADQYIANYRLEYKTVKWYKKLAYFFVHLSVSNAYACFKAENPNSGMDFKSFKSSVATSLMAKDKIRRPLSLDTEPPLSSADCVSEAVRLDRIDHFPGWISGGGEQKNFGRHCKIRGCKSCTRAYCMKCRVFLCNTAAKNCFYVWHTEKNKYKV